MLMRLGVAGCLLATTLLAIYAIGAETPNVQAALVRSVEANLAAGEVEGVQVAANGREVMLTGEVAEQFEKSRAEALAQSTSGVRSVTSEIQVGPPPVNPGSIEDQIRQLQSQNKIEFELSRTAIARESLPVLEEIRAILDREPGVTAEIRGYTDNSGSEEQNRELSQGRAESIVDWLIDQGIAAERLNAAGFGPDNPIASNDTREGRAANRRVEFVISRQ